MTHDDRERRFVVMVHDHGYLRPSRKPRLCRDAADAIKFATQEAAMKAALSYLRRTGKDRTVEVVPAPEDR